MPKPQPEPTVTLKCLINDVHPAVLKIEKVVVGKILKLQLTTCPGAEVFDTFYPDGLDAAETVIEDRRFKSAKLVGSSRIFTLTFSADSGEIILTTPAELTGIDLDPVEVRDAGHVDTTLHFMIRITEASPAQAVLTKWLKELLTVEFRYDQAELPLAEPPKPKAQPAAAAVKAAPEAATPIREHHNPILEIKELMGAEFPALTPGQEAHVVIALDHICAGRRPDEIATDLGLGKDEIRALLKVITFAKDKYPALAVNAELQS